MSFTAKTSQPEGEEANPAITYDRIKAGIKL